MNIQLRFFASLREALGSSGSLSVPESTTVGQARELLIARGAPFDAALARGRALRAALNQTLCEESAALSEGDELAFFPPVTGG
jgi:molybdopterin synthase sulfur carrier subunit